MRFIGAIACAIIVLDCLGKAMGDGTDKVFSPNFIWVWWFFAFCWVLSLFNFLLADD